LAASFFQLLKRERIKRHVYTPRSDSRNGIVDYIEIFYNNKRRRGFNDPLSPVEYEQEFEERLMSV
jgi:putative transposase